MTENFVRHEYVNEIIDIDDWPLDETYDGIYTEGAREKNALFSPKVRHQNYILPKWRYLFKLSRSKDWCPWQFWMEVVAYRFGKIIGVEVPPAWPAVSNTYKEGKKTYGALIEWFYNEKSTKYFDGGQLMTGLIENYDREKGSNHNWMSLYDISEKLNQIEHWAKVFTFDTLIGNTDRHQDNWGIKVTDDKFDFSPAFDNGTALGYEIKEENLKSYISDSNRMTSYIKKGSHHMKWSLDQKESYNFFDFMKNYVVQNPEVVCIIDKCLDFSHEQIEEAIVPLYGLIDDDRHKLTRTRVDFTIKLIMTRKRLLEETLQI